MKRVQTTDYHADWSAYALDDEGEKRFLSLDHKDLMQICDCIDTKFEDTPKMSGCIPIHFDSESGNLYILKEGPHTRVCGESGSKKSRTIVRGSIIAGAMAKRSFIVTDPKGELYADGKVRWQLEKNCYNIYVLDFRKFDKDAYNVLGYAMEMYKKGRIRESDAYIERFASMLVEANRSSSADPFWNTQAAELIVSAIKILRNSLAQQHGGETRFHLGSVLQFIRQDKDSIQHVFSSLARHNDADIALDPVRQYQDIVGASAERTYSSIVSSAKALLAPFSSSEALLKMLSIQTFDVRKMYRKPTAIFMVIPDESSAYDMIAGHLMDLFYQILIEEFSNVYQNKARPACPVDFICDEVASVRISDMASKISAARSREINFVLIYQSEAQMRKSYEKDFDTICGNTRNYIFLGSTDYEILKRVSAETGSTMMTSDGSSAPLVTVDDLRRMEKTLEYKDALLLTGNHVLCLRLPDYDVYPFLDSVSVKDVPGTLASKDLIVYTPEEVAADYRSGKIRLLGSEKLQKKRENKKVSQEVIDDVFDILFSEED